SSMASACSPPATRRPRPISACCATPACARRRRPRWRMADPAQGDLFLSLTPDKVLSAVEVSGLRATGRAFALNSYENRVYDVEMEDGSHRVMKFYRPGRWRAAAIADEHRFLAELAAEGMPVAAAEVVAQGAAHPTVGEVAGIYYASFPKVR